MALCTVLRAAAIGALLAGPATAQTAAVISYHLSPSDAYPLGVAPSPALDLGASGETEELFSRIAAVRRQSSGRILVVNGDAPEIRVFDRQGHFVRTIGRRGQGPGEFQTLDDAVVRRGDSIVTLDRRSRRITLFGPDGGYVSTIPFAPPFSTPPFNVGIDAFGDGTLLISYSEAGRPAPAPKPVSFVQHIGQYAVDGKLVHAAGTVLQGEYFIQATEPRFGGSAAWDLVFGRRGFCIASGDSFFAGDAATPEVRRYSPSGALIETHRVDIPAKSVTASDIAMSKRNDMEGVTADRRAMEQKRIDEMPYPARFPAYKRVLIDARGRIWLQLYEFPAAADSRWVVLDPGPRTARQLRLPPRFVPYVIGRDDMAGVWSDEDGVQHVRVYLLAADVTRS